MKRGLNYSYILIPSVYIIIIVGLLFLQFSGGSLFRTDIGVVSLSGSFAVGNTPQEKTLDSVRVSAMGLQLIFDTKQKLLIETDDGTTQALNLISYEKKTDGFILRFDRSATLDIRSLGTSQQQAQINLSLPADLLPLKSVRLPYAKLSGAEIKTQPNASVFDLSFAGNNFTAAMPPRSYLDSSQQQLIFPGDLATIGLRIAAKVQKNTDAYDQFIANQANIISPTDFRSQVDSYITVAYNSWKGARYNTASGTWTHRNGESRFNEQLMVALLAEAWNRDDYTRVYTEMRNAADLNPNQLSWLSAPYLGNLRRITNEMVVQDRRRAEQLLQQINQKDNNVLLVPKLIQFAVDRGGERLAAALKTYFGSLQAGSLTPAQVLGLLQQIYIWNIPDPAFESVLARFNNLIVESLLPNLMPAGDGYLFQSAPGKSDIYQTLLAARVLIGAGQKNGDDRLANLGRYMIVSILKLSDDVGYLPESVDFSDQLISAVVRSRGAEDFYELLTENQAYPKEISLFRQLGYGAWFVTIAKVNSISIKPTEYNFNIRNTPSRTHFLIFAGLDPIDPLEGMQLFGITWRNAPDFELYSKGRFYDPQTQILMIKYFDDTGVRDIKIWYN